MSTYVPSVIYPMMDITRGSLVMERGRSKEFKARRWLMIFGFFTSCCMTYSRCLEIKTHEQSFRHIFGASDKV
jgi:hypothetical protein